MDLDGIFSPSEALPRALFSQKDKEELVETDFR